MGTRCRAYDFGMSIIMLCAFVEIRSITWSLRQKLLVFGENVELSSYGSACQPNTTKRWIGGPSYKLLCYDGYSANSSKYEIMVDDSVAEFGLMIKKFAVEDIYCRYTCACGLRQHTKTLVLEGVDYIYPPDIHDNVTIDRDGTCHIDIQVDVYPFPRCVLTYEGYALPVNITKKLTKHTFRGGDLELYNVRIIHTMDVHSYIWTGEIILNCNIGKRTYTRSMLLCKDKIDANDNFNIPFFMTLIVAAFLLCVSLICYLTWKRCKKKKPITDKGYRKGNKSPERDGMMVTLT